VLFWGHLGDGVENAKQIIASCLWKINRKKDFPYFFLRWTLSGELSLALEMGIGAGAAAEKYAVKIAINKSA